ncbi:MAG: RagB/SusD family nutrient uptake outer membrane protein [Porphyromonas sp.]|nr:RagB/SusD family nutrient uptake outer membrane protein [Porphyromonas sp.]
MQTKRYIALALAASTLVVSCRESDFLDQKPQGVLSEAILNSPQGVDQLITAAYSAQMGTTQGDATQHPTTNWSYGEVRADNAYKGGGGTGDIHDIHRIETYTVDPLNGNLDAKWFHLYSSVRRCNAALRVLNAASDSEIPNRQVRIAEMKALRGHFYFELVRMYNKIVWIEESVDEQDYAAIPNGEFSRDELLGKIATDLEEAAKVLPESHSDLGRINKYMATAYAAKVNLYRAYQQNPQDHSVSNIDKALLQRVVDLTGQVINSGRYQLLSDFQHLDLMAYENGSESIWAVQYTMNDGSSEPAGRINWSMLLNTPQGPYSGDGFYLPSQNLVDAYQTDAQGLPLLDGSFNGKHYDLITFVGDKAVNNNIDSNVDPRLDFVVGRPNVRWKTYPETPYLATWVRDRGTYGYHSVKRFWLSPESPDMYKGWPWGASGLNWQVIRYAHVLLWRAEALIELGQLEEARTLINQIRVRAKNSQMVKAWTPKAGDAATYPNFNGYAAKYLINEYPANAWTQDYARRALRHEMRLETALEGDRFFDLVRWGIAAETMNKYFEVERDQRVYYRDSRFVKGRDEYYPIPLNQYKFSGNRYTQNAGYGSF